MSDEGAAPPRSSLEIERKYDVDADAVLPDWAVLPGVTTVGEAETRELRARYFDSSDGLLAGRATAVRRRTGGPDEGWHVKRQAQRGKEEFAWPLSLGDDVPEVIRSFLDVGAGVSLDAIAEIRNNRVAYALHDVTGGVVAEVVDDHVTATDLRTGRESRWREWEVELGSAASTDDDLIATFFASCDSLVEDAGGAPSASGSKLGRALGV